MDLEVTGADRRLDTVPVAPCIGKGLGDCRLAGAVEPEHAPLGLRRPLPAPAASAPRLRREARAACSSPGGPGRTTTTQVPVSSTTPGAVPAMPSEMPPSGRVACFRTPARKVRVRAAHPLGEAPRDQLDLSLERRVHTQGTPRDTRDELDRPVVVRRPEAARDQADVGLEALAQRGLELVGVVADDRDARQAAGRAAVPRWA